MTSDPKVRLFPGGPEFPAEFLDAVQKGEVVFFCGAGLSMGTGLPDFPDLVRGLDRILNPNPDDRFDKGRTDDRKGRTDYDRMLSELEDRFVPGRMRKHARDILSKPPQDPEDEVLENHRNILKLAELAELAAVPDRGFRLVTTNFDDRFARANGGNIRSDDAPKMPVPESPGWSSLVHLHGRICEGGDLNDLVLTAADFGRAYLSEGWARRFVVRLMRRWPVAFVGYGLDDPPMRYLMDAVRDPRGNPEEFKQAFALVGCKDGDEDKRREWEGKRVVPILYSDAKNHEALRNVLRELARLKDEPNYRAELAVRGTDGNPDDEGGDNGRRVVWALRNLTAVQHFVERKLMDDGDRTAAWAKSFDGAGMLRAVKSDADALSVSTPQPDLTPAAKLLVDWLCWHMQHEQILRWMEDYCDFPHPDVIERASRRVRENAPVIPEELREKWALFLLKQGRPDSFIEWRRAGFSPQVKEMLEERILEALRPGVDFAVLCPSITPDYVRSCALRDDFPGKHAETLFGYLEQMARAVSRQGVDWSSRPLSRVEEDEKRLEFHGPHIEFMELLSMKAIRQLAGKGEVSALKNRVDRWAESGIPRLIRMALFAIAERQDFSVGKGVKILRTGVDDLHPNDCIRFLRQVKGRLTPPMRRGMERAFMRPPQDKVARRLYMLEQAGLLPSPKDGKILADARAEYENSVGGPQEVEVGNMSADECANHIQAAERLNLASFVKDHPDKAIEAFEILAQREFWNRDTWSRFLNYFEQNKDISGDLAVQLIRLLEAMPDDLAHDHRAWDCARILKVISHTLPFSEIEKAWRRVWNLELTANMPDTSFSLRGDHHVSAWERASRHAHGVLAIAAVDSFFLKREGEREKLLDLLSEILASEKPSHKYGKVAVGRFVFPLFRDFPEWTRRHLLPLFAPEHLLPLFAPENSLAVDIWESFLHEPKMSADFLAAIKPALLRFMRSPEVFHDHASQLMWVFLAGCVRHPGVISPDERRKVGAKISPKGLEIFCENLERELRNKNSTEQGKKWREWILPLLQEVWPERRRAGKEASDISRALASVIILTGDAFPDASQWEQAQGFLSPIAAGYGHPMHPVTSFLDSHQEQVLNIPDQFPRECLLFLDRTVPDEGFHRQYDLHAVLDKIKAADLKLENDPSLEKHPAYIRLREIASGG